MAQLFDARFVTIVALNGKSMKKATSSKPKKQAKIRDFNKEYSEIMKGMPVTPIHQWNKPGDSFAQFSMYTHHNSTSTNNSSGL